MGNKGMSDDPQIVPLSLGKKDVDRFLKVSYAIYQNDPLWVAPLLMDVKKVFSHQNPFFHHAEMQLWVATKQGRDVGRIAGIIDQNYLQHQKDQAAFFGFFECQDDPQSSRALFEAVAAWAREKKMQRLLGPMNPTNNDECGLLVQGYDSSPAIMMTYNPPYYLDLVEAAGFQKAKDLLAFYIEIKSGSHERMERMSTIFAKRQPGIKVRFLDRKNLVNDLARIKEIYNAAWEDNWGFVPMTDAEIDFMAARMKPLLMDGLNYLAESATEPVAFMLMVPDYNQVFKPLKGRLLTLKILGALPYLLGKKRPRLVRLVAFGIKKQFRGRGVEATIFAEGLKHIAQAGFAGCEASWILEDNIKVQRLIEIFEGKVYKTYRIYQKNL